MADKGQHVWMQTIRLSSEQIKAMPAEVIKHSVEINMGIAEDKARGLGIEEPKVEVLFIAEFLMPLDEEEDEEDEEVKPCATCGQTDGPYPKGDRPTSTAPIRSGCPRCGSCL